MTALELVNEILERETELRSLYGQLQNKLSRQQWVRQAQRLRSLQSRQISILGSLQEDLEGEVPDLPGDRFYAQHILQTGETLSVLAREYGTTVSEIRRVNPDLPQQPRPGQLINLPREIPRPPQNSFRYLVRRGDTLFNIAQRYNTDVETLVRLNNIANPDIIFPGRILIIPNS
ncbi:MAG: LysM peptidoglycan-binding domain-containing protein [bacterium]